jgi:hypothetical protein
LFAVNTISGNGFGGVAYDSGVYVVNGASLTFNGNALTGNALDGILIATGCSAVDFGEMNAIQSNQGYGVEIVSAVVGDPSLTLNVITLNALGNLHRG